MNALIKENPGLTVMSVLVYAALTVVHLIAAMEYAKKNERPFMEGLALTVFMIAAWPLFSIGMMFKGYAEFWKKTWGND